MIPRCVLSLGAESHELGSGPQMAEQEVWLPDE